jgi:hypothetical protein
MKTVTVAKLTVPNWKSRFEKSDNKKCTKLGWLAFPLDSDEWNELADHSKSAIHLLAWIAILRAAARCEPRGTLLQTNGRPHDAASLSKNSGLSAKLFEKTISIFLKKGYLISEMVQVLDLDEDSSQSAPSPSTPLPATGKQVGREVGITGKQALQGGSTGNEDSAKLPPAIEEKRTFAQTSGETLRDGKENLNYYQQLTGSKL